MLKLYVGLNLVMAMATFSYNNMQGVEKLHGTSNIKLCLTEIGGWYIFNAGVGGYTLADILELT